MVTTGFATIRTGTDGDSASAACHLARMIGDALQHGIAVEMLAAGDEPELQVAEAAVARSRVLPAHFTVPVSSPET